MLKDGDPLPPNTVVFPRGTVDLMVRGKAAGASVFDWFLDAREWVKAIGEDYLNSDMKALPLKDVIVPPGETAIFMKPLLAHKSFNGNPYKPNDVIGMQKAAKSRKTSWGSDVDESHPYPESMMLVASLKELDAIDGFNDDRWWWVEGKLFQDAGADKVDPADVRKIKYIFKRLYRQGKMPIMTADFCKVKGVLKMAEMNGPNFAGFYDEFKNAPKIAKAIIGYLARHGKTVRENLKTLPVVEPEPPVDPVKAHPSPPHPEPVNGMPIVPPDSAALEATPGSINQWTYRWLPNMAIQAMAWMPRSIATNAGT